MAMMSNLADSKKDLNCRWTVSHDNRNSDSRLDAPADGMLSLLRKAFGSQESVLLALVLLIVYVGNENSQFLATRVASLFAGNAYIAIAALGMTMVIVLGPLTHLRGIADGDAVHAQRSSVVWDGYPSWLS